MVLRRRNENTGALKRTCNPLLEEMPRHLLTALFPKTRGRLALQATACPWKIGSFGPRVFLGRGHMELVRLICFQLMFFTHGKKWGLGWSWYTLKISFRELTEVSHQTLIFDHLLRSIVQICADTFVGSFKVQILWEAQQLDDLESISCGKQSTHSVPKLAHQLRPKACVFV